MLSYSFGIFYMITNIFRWNIVHARQDGADMFGMVDVTSRYGDLDAVILLRIIHVNKTTPRCMGFTSSQFVIFF